jgi:hypothetical protein
MYKQNRFSKFQIDLSMVCSTGSVLKQTIRKTQTPEEDAECIRVSMYEVEINLMPIAVCNLVYQNHNKNVWHKWLGLNV